MKPAAFDYVLPSSVEEAVSALAGEGDRKVLAGGQSLIPVMAMRLVAFDELIDLRAIDELKRIEITDDSATVGAMVRQATAEQHQELCAAVPLLGQALAHVGHFQIRNRGTIGGSIAHADPAAELPAVALALNASMEVAGQSGRRTVTAADFFESTFTTALAENEILTSIRFPIWGPQSGFAVEEISRRHGDFAIVGTACGVRIDNGAIAAASIGLFGMGSTPLRAPDAEALLIGTNPGDVDLGAIGTTAVGDLEPTSDVHASSEYRKAVGANVVAQAVTRAIEEAQRG